MNAVDEGGPMALRVRHEGLGADFTKTDAFKGYFRQSPCRGCCSSDHSLLGLESTPRTRSGKVTYKYLCPVVEHENLYVKNPRCPEDELNITYFVIVERYARVHQYNVEECLNKLALLHEGNAAEPPWYMDSFIGEFRRLCRIYGEEDSGDREVQRIEDMKFDEVDITTFGK